MTSILFGGSWVDGGKHKILGRSHGIQLTIFLHADGLPESELIEPAQWQALMKLYGPDGVKVVEEPIEASEGIGEEEQGQRAREQSLEVLLTHNGDEWVWQPVQCLECIDAAVNEANLQRRTFTNRVVRVVTLKRGQVNT